MTEQEIQAAVKRVRRIKAGEPLGHVYGPCPDAPNQLPCWHAEYAAERLIADHATLADAYLALTEAEIIAHMRLWEQRYAELLGCDNSPGSIAAAIGMMQYDLAEQRRMICSLRKSPMFEGPINPPTSGG